MNKYYILYDNELGTILGLDINPKNIDSSWITLSEEAYYFILDNNGLYKIELNELKNRQEEYNLLSDKDKNDYIMVIKDILIPIEREVELEDIINSIISKNSNWCSKYITKGIRFKLDDGTVKYHSYDTANQINIEQINNLIEEGVLQDSVPIKFRDEEIYTFISISEFKRLYRELIKNKYFHLFYLREYNDYVKTITDTNKLHRLSYETGLPEEYRAKVNEKLKLFDNIGGGN